MRQSEPVDGFRLAYERSGHGPAVVLLHGWPGDHSDYRHVVPLVSATAEVVVADLRGFGESDKHPSDPATQYNAVAQARSVVGLIEELGLDRPVIAGYDIGSRIAQAIARSRPDLVRALVISPPLPGTGERILQPRAQREFWYQPFHQLELSEQLIDGRPEAVRAYLRHFWSHWSGPAFDLTTDHLDHLVSVYEQPGAFTASVAWYRAGAGAVATSVAEKAPSPQDRIAVPTTVLWPEHDPLFPREWSDRLDDFFTDIRLRHLDGVGHFTPVESPGEFSAAVQSVVDLQPLHSREVIARARLWIASPRPYSQELIDPESGYRMDCSGYVSMAWKLDPPGLTTVELPDVATLITKEELRTGDVVMIGGPETEGDAGHVIIFEQWHDPDMTRMWAFEQTGRSTLHHVIDYPPAPYLPYRRLPPR
jgi:pimeloyl-ACP methyl ester carboxylesterase